MTMFMQLLNLSPVMIVLMILSIISIAVFLERLLYWRNQHKQLKRSCAMPIQRLKDQAIKTRLLAQLASKKCKHYTERLTLCALKHPGNNALLEQKAFEHAQEMNEHLGLLALFARIAPLIGILGTVVGMATSFGGISNIAGASPEQISAGISTALTTTAIGLVISIFNAMSVVYFKKQIQTAIVHLSRTLCDVQQIRA